MSFEDDEVLPIKPILTPQQEARKEKFRQKFTAQGKSRARSLSASAERTAQRRGRGFDPLETVINQSVPPPPKPKTQKELAFEALGCSNSSQPKGSTVPRGVSFICPGVPLQFTGEPSVTTQRELGPGVANTQKILRSFGLDDLIPPSPSEIRNKQRQAKIAGKKCRSGDQAACGSFRTLNQELRKLGF